MPYVIRKRDEKWCVFKEGADEPLGCHDTQEEADAQQAALYASEGKSVGDALKRIIGEANVGDLLESRIHAAFTDVADRLFGLGYLTKEERLALSHAIGQGLDAYSQEIVHLGLENRQIEEFHAAEIVEDTRSVAARSVSMVALGGAVKALPGGRVGGYLVVFSPGGEPKDLYGEYFERDTEFAWSGQESRLSFYDHGLDEQFGGREVGAGIELKRIDDFGMWVENQLNMSDEYDAAIYGLAQKNRLGMSSGTAEHLVQVAEDGKVLRWPIAEGSYTVKPAEPRTKGRVISLKQYRHTPWRSLLGESGRDAPPEAPVKRGPGATRKPKAARGVKHSTHKFNYTHSSGPGGKGTMDIEQLIALIKAQLELSEEDLAQLDALVQAFLLGSNGGGTEPPPEETPSEDLIGEGQLSVTVDALVAALKKAGIGGGGTKTEPPAGAKPKRPAYSFGDQGGGTKKADDQAALFKSVHTMRHGAVDGSTDVVMREVYNGDYQQAAYEQEQAFLKYLRTGRDDKLLHRQMWGIRAVSDMLKSGFSVAYIKATMVEGMDELGGYAVPPQMQDTILKRIVGLSAVRGGGALIVQTASNMVEWIKITGGGERYPSSMRGQWGDETTAGTADNFEIGLNQIPVNVYSYPVDFSRSLLEDASNLEQIFTALVADTLAMDEDEAFLIGDGANKPRGILPGSTNTDSLTEVISQHATLLTWTGLKALRRGISSQYRLMDRASWIGNSDTGSDIEQLQDGEGRDYLESLNAGEPVEKLRGVWRESEAMPDVAASAYPLIFGDLTGYAIVERMGMSVDRFHDSNTGAKKFRFEVYRRLGGKVIEPWKFAIQKVSAT